MHEEGDFIFVEDLNPYVALIRDRSFILGHLDSEGNFLPSGKLEKYAVGQPFSGPAFRELNSVPTASSSMRVYEFRSGRLIPGVIQKSGNFVPDLDGKIIAFKDYKYSMTAVPIYNLPGTFVKKKEEK